MPHAWRSELSSLSCPLRHTGVARTHGNAKSGARGGENRTQHGKFDCIPIPHHHADLPPIFWPSCREQTRPKIFYVGAVRGHVRSYLKWRNGGRGGGAGRKSCMPYEYRLPTTVPASRSSQSRPLRAFPPLSWCSSAVWLFIPDGVIYDLDSRRTQI